MAAAAATDPPSPFFTARGGSGAFPSRLPSGARRGGGTPEAPPEPSGPSGGPIPAPRRARAAPHALDPPLPGPRGAPHRQTFFFFLNSPRL